MSQQVLSESGRWYTPRTPLVRLANRARLLLTAPPARAYGTYPDSVGRPAGSRVAASVRWRWARAAHPRDFELHAPLRRR